MAGDVVLGVGVRVGVVGGVVRDYHGGGTVEKVCDVVRVETRRKKMIKLREIDASLFAKRKVCELFCGV